MDDIDPDVTPRQRRIIEALSDDDPSMRLQAAMAAGATPDPVFLEPLMQRCASDPDFFVRDTVSWALTRLPDDLTLPRVRADLYSTDPQTLAQAIHTLSKINDPTTYPWITPEMLADPHDQVARTAWRAAVVLAPRDQRTALAHALVGQLGRGPHDLQLALTRALVDLGDASVGPVDDHTDSPDLRVAAHARATVFYRHDPGVGFDGALERAVRSIADGRLTPWRP